MTVLLAQLTTFATDIDNVNIEFSSGAATVLKIVIATKLRRQESFMMTWLPITDGPDQRATVWIHPAIPLQFGFDAAAPAAIDPHLIAEMMKSLNATGELVLDHLVAPR